MQIYKNGVLIFETTDSATLEAMIESLSNALYNNHYTKSEIMALIASSRAVVQVASMPSTPTRSTLYYVGTSSPYNVKLVDSNGTIVDMGSSEIDLTGYLKIEDIATSFSTSSTNDKVAGALAVFNSFAPKQSGTYVGQFLSPNNCILPFGFSRQLNMSNERATINGMFVSQMVDPINSSINLFGALKVTQQCYGGSAGGTATNIVIEQTFETFLRGTPTQRKVFFRRGYVANSATDININDTSAIANAITWLSWYPLEYPTTLLTLKNNCTGNASFSVNGGILCLSVNITPSVTARCNFATLPLFPLNSPVNCGGIAINNTGTSSTLIWASVNSGGINVDLFSPTTLDRYFGTMVIPLGY